MVGDIYIFFKEAYQNKDAVFLSLGLICPFLLFCHKFSLWYNDFYTLLDPIYGLTGLNRFIEPLLFYYLPTIIIFCYISRKDVLFYSKVYQKIPILFQYFSLLCNIEIYFCKNLRFGFLSLTSPLFFILFFYGLITFLFILGYFYYLRIFHLQFFFA